MSNMTPLLTKIKKNHDFFSNIIDKIGLAELDSLASTSDLDSLEPTLDKSEINSSSRLFYQNDTREKEGESKPSKIPKR